jgi:hypothetical protein
MIFTIDPGKIAEFLRKQIRESEDIRQYCMETYGKELTVMGIYNELNPPTAADSPLLTLLPLGKNEGQGMATYDYDFVGILQTTPIEMAQGEAQLTELIQLIQKTIFYSREDRPLSSFSVGFDLVGAHPMAVGYIDFTYSLTPTLGVEFEF